MGIEALSRGASHVWFLERNRAAVELIRENLATLKVERRATVVPGHAALTIARHHADIVFLDPPYDQEREYTAVLEQLAEAPPPLLIVQHSVRFTVPDAQGALHRTRTRPPGRQRPELLRRARVPAPTPTSVTLRRGCRPARPAWAFMSNVSNWTDPPAEFILDGPFADGSRGATVMPGQPEREWHLRDVRPPETYTVVGDLGGATLSCIWTFEPIGAASTRLTQRLVLEGEKAGEFRDPIEAAFGPNLAPGMARIAALIERSSL